MPTREDLFWQKVDREGPIPVHVPNIGRCWIWTAAKARDGYGTFGGGRLYRQRSAHRASYEFTRGSIPSGLLVLHVCDNPACVRPDHLRLGTQLQNRRDAVEKHRTARGERTGAAKLTEAAVKALREARTFDPKHFSQNKLARIFGVSQAVVWHILKRHTWRHI